MAAVDEGHAFVTEGGEGGEAAAEAGGEEQTLLSGEIPMSLHLEVEEADEQAAQEVDQEGRPGEEDLGILGVALHVSPEHRGHEA